MKKWLKVSGITLGLLALIILVPPMFMASTYSVSTSIEVQSTPYNVFPYFADLKNWKQWSPWVEKDTTANYRFSKNTFGAGSTMSWVSKNKEVGTGSFTTVQFKK